MEKPTMQRIRRSVCEHRWNDIDEWARSFHELAELDDHDLAELTRLTGGEPRHTDD